jgi:hypothetical protein
MTPGQTGCSPQGLRWTQGSAHRAGRVGVSVLKRPRHQDAEAVVPLSWRDWQALERSQKPAHGIRGQV